MTASQAPGAVNKDPLREALLHLAAVLASLDPGLLASLAVEPGNEM